MKERFNTGCPLCDGAASYVLVDSTNYMAYTCSTCGIFEISTHAEKLVREMPQERRAFYVSLVEFAPEEQLLEISFEVLATGNRIAHRYISVRR
ncbi:hypothetical protein [Pectobacterium odoriferum]|uniref:hypothetical protein n=1 Tax=Pectobacterium odoriferum TaxID=78398 RepID=UPI0011AF66C1|nr:hypothetical protein [Pectobacterium odoriferum]MBA0188285.1 hypothetical protein [Pectobacterium odoriferum]